MKIDFIIISGILVIISFLPFILLPLIINTGKKNLRKKFKGEALASGLNISYELTWNSNIAGLDILKKQFLFVQKPDGDFVIHHVNLNKIREVKMVSQYTEFNLQNKPVKTLSRVDLEFFENISADPVRVNLFNYDLNYTEDFEIKNAEKLVAELQKYLNALPILKRTA